MDPVTGLQQTTIRAPEADHKLMKLAAAASGMSFNEWALQALRKAMTSDAQEKRLTIKADNTEAEIMRLAAQANDLPMGRY